MLSSKVGSDLLDLVNRTGRNDPEIDDLLRTLTLEGHRTLQQGVMDIVVKVIKAHAAKSEHGYDLRNEATVKLCKAIVERCQDELHLPFI